MSAPVAIHEAVSKALSVGVHEAQPVRNTGQIAAMAHEIIAKIKVLFFLMVVLF